MAMPMCGWFGDARERPVSRQTRRFDNEFPRRGEHRGRDRHSRMPVYKCGQQFCLEQSVHNRTPVLLSFRVELPSVTATARWGSGGGCRLGVADQADLEPGVEGYASVSLTLQTNRAREYRRLRTGSPRIGRDTQTDEPGWSVYSASRSARRKSRRR